MENLEQENEAINDGNKKTELDMKWDVSKTKKISLIILVGIVLIIELISPFWLSPVILILGFLVAARLFKVIRKIWEKIIK